VKETETRPASKWWLLSLLLLPALAVWWMRSRRARQPKVIAPPSQKPVSYAEKLIGIDVSSMPDKEACLKLQKILAEAGKEYPSMSTAQKSELRSICEDCQLLAYSSVEEEGKKEELKRRAVRLLLEIEN
jgi:hypothetical protein